MAKDSQMFTFRRNFECQIRFLVCFQEGEWKPEILEETHMRSESRNSTLPEIQDQFERSQFIKIK